MRYLLYENAATNYFGCKSVFQGMSGLDAFSSYLRRIPDLKRKTGGKSLINAKISNDCVKPVSLSREQVLNKPH